MSKFFEQTRFSLLYHGEVQTLSDTLGYEEMHEVHGPILHPVFHIKSLSSNSAKAIAKFARFQDAADALILLQSLKTL